MGNVVPFIQKPEILRFKNFALPEVAMKIVFVFEGHAKYCEQAGELEDAGYYRKLAQDIMEHGTDPYINEICDYISDIFWSVDGMPSQYLGEKDIRFLQAVCEYREGEIEQ
ncbi:hypothetical protein A5N82_12915 [Christensenella minuta]|uniref:Uncharacterized protein n=1 Tax=Christensenella minuta TaxID=626937 RepID=A0A136Q8N4_9FIRM|nr:hypothetical protein [Christensenella minuta]AYH41300.1 hypothetical protein B1H56_12695 [Christensenella minuta]AYH41335.1 hypothetical protein B1H56_12885 [Christensenella minuta]KXK66964.1 hypothetical protein HMPREF3293_00176 [Christensenella minuta]OAQ39355.1 hypothetical protein A5N82_12915 [Christensenella minuta]